MLTTTFLQSMSDVTADQKLFAMLKLKELWRKTKWTVETEGHGPNLVRRREKPEREVELADMNDGARRGRSGTTPARPGHGSAAEWHASCRKAGSSGGGGP